MKTFIKIWSAFFGKHQCSGWKPSPGESWEEETLRLLNEAELGEALKMFRQYHRMVSRFVCMDCGFTSPSFVRGKVCDKCGGGSVEMMVVVDPHSDKARRIEKKAEFKKCFNKDCERWDLPPFSCMCHDVCTGFISENEATGVARRRISIVFRAPVWMFRSLAEQMRVLKPDEPKKQNI